MFDKLIKNQAQNLMETADLNNDGKPDKAQIEKIAADLGKAVEDAKLAIDGPKATAALALIQQGSTELLNDSKTLASLAAAGNFKGLAKEVLSNEELHEDLGKCFAGIFLLSKSIDGTKLAVATQDLKVAQESLEAYINPPNKKKK